MVGVGVEDDGGEKKVVVVRDGVGVSVSVG